MREPDKLLGRRVEAAILDHANPRVLAGHVRAAAYEAPLTESDEATLGPEALDAARADPELQGHAGRDRLGRAATIRRRGSPLRSTEPDAFTVVDGDDRRRARPRRAEPRLHDRARGRGLPPPRRVVPRPRARPDDAARGRRAVRRQLVHAGEAGDDDADRRAATGRVAARPRAGVRRDRGDRAGRRATSARRSPARSGSSSSRSSCRRRRSRPRRSGSCRSRTSSPSSTRCRSCSARCTPRSTR